MSRRRTTVIPMLRLWLMALPFRLWFRRRPDCFNPGLRHLLRFEGRRLVQGLCERERLAYWKQKLKK